MLRGEVVGLQTAEGVADADDFLELLGCNAAAAKKLNQLVRNRDLRLDLNDLDRVWVVGEAGAESVVEESRVSLFGGVVDVRVSRRNVPVRAVKAGAVDQELDCCRADGAGGGWEAELGVDAVGAADGGLTTEELRLER